MKITESRLRRIIKEELSGVRRPQTHGLRHNQELDIDGHLLVVNMEDPEWVQVNTAEGMPVARQAKFSGGRVYQQFTPDYEGSETYPLQYYVNGAYEDWDSEAARGDIRYALRKFIAM